MTNGAKAPFLLLTFSSKEKWLIIQQNLDGFDLIGLGLKARLRHKCGSFLNFFLKKDCQIVQKF